MTLASSAGGCIRILGFPRYRCGRPPALRSPTLRGNALPRLHGGAGWSSPVARQAHNLKVAGSNPAPATNFFKDILAFWQAAIEPVIVSRVLHPFTHFHTRREARRVSRFSGNIRVFERDNSRFRQWSSYLAGGTPRTSDHARGPSVRQGVCRELVSAPEGARSVTMNFYRQLLHSPAGPPGRP